MCAARRGALPIESRVQSPNSRGSRLSPGRRQPIAALEPRQSVPLTCQEPHLNTWGPLYPISFAYTQSR